MTDQPGQPDEQPPVSELLAVRRAKLERLREQGVDPFPHSFDGVTPIGDILPVWDHLEAGEETCGAEVEGVPVPVDRGAARETSIPSLARPSRSCRAS
mgnify:CR=1 FL=1